MKKKKVGGTTIVVLVIAFVLILLVVFFRSNIADFIRSIWTPIGPDGMIDYVN